MASLLLENLTDYGSSLPPGLEPGHLDDAMNDQICVHKLTFNQ